MLLGFKRRFEHGRNVHKYEVCLTMVGSRGNEFRMPPVQTEETAQCLAEAMAMAYPGALVEIAHQGMRTVVA